MKFDKRRLREILPGLLLIVLTLLLSLEFLRRNWVKVDDTVALAKAVVKAEGPHVFEIMRGEEIVYRKVFRYRKDGIYLAGDVPDDLVKKSSFTFKLNSKILDKESAESGAKFIKLFDGKSNYLLVSEKCSREDFIEIYRKLRCK